jgi:hypothetical protein
MHPYLDLAEMAGITPQALLFKGFQKALKTKLPSREPVAGRCGAIPRIGTV